MEKGKKTSKKAKPGINLSSINVRYVAIGAAALLVLLVLIFVIRGCGRTKNPSVKVVRNLIEYSVAGNTKKMKSCYGVKGDASTDLQAEIDATVAYYKAHNVNKLNIKQCDTIFDKETYAYIYIVYDLMLDNDQAYPCIGTYMVQKQDGKCTVMAPAKIDDSLWEEAKEAYVKFMTTDAYKNYAKAYDTFIKKNPGYEDKIIGKLA